MQRKVRLNLLFYIPLVFILMFSKNLLFAQEKIELTLAECIKMALDNDQNLPNISSNKIAERQAEKKEETVYKIKTLYYDLLLTKELIKLAEDVKSNFEKAYKKADEKLESEDPEITQQDVLKLKLGLAGSKDELNSLDYEEKEIIESLKYELGISRNKKFDIKTRRLRQEKIDLKKIKRDFDLTFSDKSSLKKKEDIFRITKVFLKINKAEKGIKIAREARKVSRGLLVTNLANFDFGIGEAKDLFESLFIYMRSVKNYFKKVHGYNLAIAELSYETGKNSSN